MNKLLKYQAMQYLQNTPVYIASKQLGFTPATIHNLKSGRKELKIVHILAIGFLRSNKIFNNGIEGV